MRIVFENLHDIVELAAFPSDLQRLLIGYRIEAHQSSTNYYNKQASEVTFTSEQMKHKTLDKLENISKTT